MATTGSTLKALRLKRGRTLDEIAKVTRIPKATIEQLEADHVSKLPAPVYVKGFIRLYCQAVQVDPREVVDLYEREQLARLQRASFDQTSIARAVMVEDRPRSRAGVGGVRVSHLVLLLFAALTFLIALLTTHAPSSGAEVSSASPAGAPSADSGDTVSSVARSSLRQ